LRDRTIALGDRIIVLEDRIIQVALWEGLLTNRRTLRLGRDQATFR